MARKRIKRSYGPRPCDGPCKRPIPVEEPGWVIMLDTRLLCYECYRAECAERAKHPYGKGKKACDSPERVDEGGDGSDQGGVPPSHKKTPRIRRAVSKASKDAEGSSSRLEAAVPHTNRRSAQL